MSVTWSYEWAKPNTPDVVSRQLIMLSQELEELREPMMVAGEIARLDIQERFVTKTSPSGRIWDAWALSYAPYALTHNTGGMLVQEGDTRDAINDRSAFVGTNQGLFLDTSGIPEWGMWNNFGAKRHTAGMSEEDKAANEAVRGFDLGEGDREDFGNLSGENYLPPRPFLGITSEAEFKMDAAFYAWFEGEVAFATSSRGKPFFRHAKRDYYR